MTDSTISADAVLKGLEFLRDMYGPTAVDPAMQKPLRDAIALIQHQSAELQALRAQGRWVPVDERLPEPNLDLGDGQHVANILVSNEGAVCSALFDPASGRWGVHGLDIAEPSHWRELPPPPAGESRCA